MCLLNQRTMRCVCDMLCRGLVVSVLTLAVCRGATAVTLCAGDFDSQVRHLLATEMLAPAEIHNLTAVFHDFNATLQTRWPGSAVLPAGSLLDGLTMGTSDADCVVTVPHHDEFTQTENYYLIRKTAKLLKRQPELYTNIRQVVLGDKNKIFLLKFDYVPTGRKCDVSFISTRPLDISGTAGLFYSLDRRAFNTAAIIKIWFKLQKANYACVLTSYTINSLIIFYLQQKDILPSLYHLQRSLNSSTPNNKSKYKRIANDSPSLYELIGGFFTYYSDFNFDEYVISPLIGRPIHKTEFDSIDTLPEELSAYKSFMKKPNSIPIALNTKLCIQDMLLPQLNIIAESAKPEIIDYIKTLMVRVKVAAVKFRKLPSDLVLAAVLGSTHVNDETKTVNRCPNSTVPVRIRINS